MLYCIFSAVKVVLKSANMYCNPNEANRLNRAEACRFPFCTSDGSNLSLCLLQAPVVCKICTCADYIKDQATSCKTEASVPSKTEVVSSGAPEFPRSLQLWCCAERASQSIHVLHEKHCVQVVQLPDVFLCAW